METHQSQNISATMASPSASHRPTPTTYVNSWTANNPGPTPPATPGSDEGSAAGSTRGVETPRPSTLFIGAKKKVARGRSFSTAEDEAMTNAWVRVSEDAIVGSDQKGETFFKAIADLYATLKPAYCQHRTTESVKKRVKKLLQECLMFGTHVAKINRAQPSGTNSDDVVHLATALYNKLEISSVTDSSGPPFKFLSCWTILKEHPKFDVLSQPPEKRNTDESATQESARNDETNSDAAIEAAAGFEPYSRPVGRKRAKQLDARSELDRKNLKVAEATLKAQQERNELIRTHQEMLLFTSTSDASDPVASEYMKIMRKRALERLKTSISQSETPEPPSYSDPSEHQI